MNTLLIVAAFASLSGAVSIDGFGVDGFKARRGTDLIAPMPMQWLRTYPISPYKEHWNMSIEVKVLDKEFPRVLEAFEKSGAVLIVPLANALVSETDRSRQLSYRVTTQNTKALLKRLRSIGQCSDPVVRPVIEPVPIQEVKEKIDKLMADKKAHAAELAKMPAVSALADELLEHLFLVEHMRERAAGEVLLNMTVREPAK